MPSGPEVALDTMLRVSEYLSFWLRGQVSERTIMGNVAVADELAGIDEPEELHQLNASEPEPGDDEEEEDEGTGVEPDVMPEPAKPAVMPEPAKPAVMPEPAKPAVMPEPAKPEVMPEP
jgi:hypothetical protein